MRFSRVDDEEEEEDDEGNRELKMFAQENDLSKC